MKLEKSNLTGNHARRMLHAVVALLGGTKEQANAIGLEGDISDLVRDWMGLKKLPGVNLPSPDIRSSGSSNRGSSSAMSILVDDNNTITMVWKAPKASFAATDDVTGVDMRLYTKGRETPSLHVTIDLNERWDASVYPYNPTEAFWTVLLGDK